MYQIILKLIIPKNTNFQKKKWTKINIDRERNRYLSWGENSEILPKIWSGSGPIIAAADAEIGELFSCGFHCLREETGRGPSGLEKQNFFKTSMAIAMTQWRWALFMNSSPYSRIGVVTGRTRLESCKIR